jgi:tRNA wybutosine-synthesizing protein 3
MKKGPSKFDMQREKAMNQLAEARRDGKADEDIADLVDLINSNPGLYTTSSCAGRIAVLQTPKEHDKLESEWLGKWHHRVTLKNLQEALAKHEKYVVYLQAECPILHVVARNLESAEKILFAAQQCGFKRSGIQAVNPERVLVEICSTESLEAPLAEEGKLLIDGVYLGYLANIANIKLSSGREKLARLQKRLESGL